MMFGLLKWAVAKVHRLITADGHVLADESGRPFIRE
jgi:hypothetical protein